MENVISSFYLEEDTTQEKLVEDAYLNAELYNQQLFLNQERENYDTVLNFTSTQIMAPSRFQSLMLILPFIMVRVMKY